MLKVKHLHLLKAKNWKKAEFLPRLQEKSNSALSNASDLRAQTLLFIELWWYSPNNL